MRWFVLVAATGCAAAPVPESAGVRVVPTPADCPVGETCLVLAADDAGYDAMCAEEAPAVCSQETADPSLSKDPCATFHCSDCVCFPCFCAPEF
jgi:hypothetical protein